MKKKLLSSLLVVGTSLGALAPATILATDVIGEPTADITINGSLGLDNTDPEEEIEEGNTNWINVTLDTATIFYNLSGTTTIDSPTYNIENNSGRPVKVSIQSFTQTDTSNISVIDSLNFVSSLGGSAITQSLINSGNVEAFGSPVELFTLANSEGNLTEDGSGTDSKSTTFKYEGTVSGTSIARTNPAFTLTLQLDAVPF
ncbi:hypothetical protein [Candidatus Enterococcus mangumiae]|uniref:WxL domain-containing protein n=1 Tax=Candidatus Enterococcus mangumiae TaxID=2230878 RepID=A0ABZ2T4P2_9ENTE|nr:hypothetical protein [Enterococcus sp. DIV1094]MBO0489896.1 hypothetical protein [Enterococcus sp. DIV1094]